MAFVPLKDSVLWRDNVRAVRTASGMTASILEAMAFQFLIVGNGMRWTADGCLREERGDGLRDAYKPADPEADPVAHPFFAMVPAIDNARFLKRMSDDPYKQAANTREIECNAFNIEEGSPILGMRDDADIHHIVGAALLMKHYLTHPERLCGRGADHTAELARARQCLNGCFEIVAVRGDGAGFAASCIDFVAALDEMTAMGDEHVRQAQISYDTQLMHKGLMDGLTGAVKKALTDDGTQSAHKKRNQEMLRSALERFGKGPKP